MILLAFSNKAIKTEKLITFQHHDHVLNFFSNFLNLALVDIEQYLFISCIVSHLPNTHIHTCTHAQTFTMLSYYMHCL